MAAQLLPALRGAHDGVIEEIAVSRKTALGGGPVRVVPGGFLLKRLSAPWRQLAISPLLGRIPSAGQVMIQTEPCLYTRVRNDSRLVVFLYDLIPLLVPQDYLAKASPMERWLLRTRQPERFRTAHKVVAISHEVERCGIQLIGLDPSRIEVIYPGLNHSGSDVAPENDVKAPFFLHVGAIESRKNIRRLVQAFAEAPIPQDHLLVFAGPMAPFRIAMLEGWAAEFGVTSRIRVLGHVTDSALRALYRDCLAFAFPSLHEGFGFPPLEAMSHGTPVLASNSSCLPEVLGDAALWCDGLDVASIAEAIGKLASRSDLRGDLRQRGPVQAARYTWERCGRNLSDLVRSLEAA